MPLIYEYDGERLIEETPSDMVAGFVTYKRDAYKETLYAVTKTGKVWQRTQKLCGPNFHPCSPKDEHWQECSEVPPYAEWIGRYLAHVVGYPVVDLT